MINVVALNDRVERERHAPDEDDSFEFIPALGSFPSSIRTQDKEMLLSWRQYGQFNMLRA